MDNGRLSYANLDDKLHFSKEGAGNTYPLLESACSSRKYDAVYECAMSSGRTAFIGVGFSVLFSLFCIAGGIFIASGNLFSVLSPSPNNPHAVITGVLVILPGQMNTAKREALSLSLSVVVTICTESIGFVHAVALKSALSLESRLRFNTNLRLLTAARGQSWFHPNGILFNTIMAILLIISYVSSSLAFMSMDPTPPTTSSPLVFSVPVIILGIVLLLQASIAIAGAHSGRILTWSSSPMDTTVALLHGNRLTRTRCMRSVFDAQSVYEPQMPSEVQPSAWMAHRSIRKIIILLWVLVPACAIWGGIAMGWSMAPAVKNNHGGSWAFFPNLNTDGITYSSVALDQSLPPYMWVVIYITFTGIQGPLTLGLHCSEVVANIVRDEATWRKASSKNGTEPTNNALTAVLGSWFNVLLLIAKPLLHWMFSLCLNAQSQYTGFSDPGIEVSMRPIQIWYLTITLFIFASMTTFVATRRPRGPQPAAYGHLQTLANLVDEWSPTMWWGHKEDGSCICRAGTSDRPLPPVRMGTWYAGINGDLL